MSPKKEHSLAAKSALRKIQQRPISSMKELSKAAEKTLWESALARPRLKLV